MDNTLSPNKDSVIVLSGGLDSTTLLYEQRERVALAVSFDYGSNHNPRELACAADHCRRLGVEHLVIPLEFIKSYFSSSLLEGAETVPTGEYDDVNMRSTVVPFRNGIMLAIACGIAESRGLDRLLIANHGGDHAIYPDCRPGFISAIDAATQAGTYNHVRVDAPYTNLTKSDIVRRGAELGVDYSATYSCYRGGDRHCGHCATCTERKEAFRQAGICDPTEYENEQSVNH